MSLEEYNAKRDFSQTSEPEGKSAKSDGELIFVIQRHAASRLHYDLRLEMDGVLKSWAIPKGPSLNPDDKRLAVQTEDHPYDYKDFEGNIPAGNYGAGEMEIWDSGTYEALNKTKGKSDDLVLRAELHKGSIKIVLHGKKLKGEFALVKIKNAEDNSWLLIKHKDEFALDFYEAEEQTDSDSKVTAYLQEKKGKRKNVKEKTEQHYRNFAPALAGEKKLKKFIVPMTAKSSEKIIHGKDWAFEIKWDGYRAIADLTDGVKLYSRNGLDFSNQFRKIANALLSQPHSMIIDGEIVAYGADGKPNFQLLQQIGQNKNLTVVYQVFDLLFLNGHSVQGLSYLQRKELLKEALVENEFIKYHDHVLEDGKQFFKLVEDMGLEGMMAKKTDSTYSVGIRSSEWLKVKTQQTDEVIICGYTEPKGSRKYFGSLILGKYSGKKLEFAGHIGTGFSDKLLKELHATMQPLITEKIPFDTVPKTNGKATWLKPELVAEIKYSEITNDHIYRHPVFLHLRNDKKPTELNCTDDKNPEQQIRFAAPSENQTASGKTEANTVKLSNQKKIYFPQDGISKGDVIRYYQSISEFILPHLKDRPQSLNRFPNGIDGLSFYQKDAAEHTPKWIETQDFFSESSDKTISYIICNDSKTLAYLNNLGCIDLNVWTCRYQKPDHPDYLVLDLDPSENNTFEEVIETALAVQQVLSIAEIEGFPKTSGSTGIHIYIPLAAKYTYEQAKNFGHLLMTFVQRQLPDLTTLERSLSKRDRGKIYLDYLQNRRGQTLASVYSLRPKNGGPVSTPLRWNELKSGMLPTDFNIENTLQRILENGELFQPVLSQETDIARAVNLLEKQK